MCQNSIWRISYKEDNTIHDDDEPFTLCTTPSYGVVNLTDYIRAFNSTNQFHADKYLPLPNLFLNLAYCHGIVLSFTIYRLVEPYNAMKLPQCFYILILFII